LDCQGIFNFKAAGARHLKLTFAITSLEKLQLQISKTVAVAKQLQKKAVAKQILPGSLW